MRLFTLILSLFFCIAKAQTLPFSFQGSVVGVSDGDTIKVLYLDNQEVKIRLLHIDAPEKGQDFSKKAKALVSELCFGKEVSIVWQKKDQYGRLLAEVFAQEINVNKELVKEGLAWHFKQFSDDKDYAELERLAQINRKGLWQLPDPTPPWLWRKMKRDARKK